MELNYDLQKLIDLKKLFFCWACGYISNLAEDHYQDGCINCMGKCE